MEYAWLPSSTALSWPVTVSVCTTFQLAAVNVKEDAESAPSAGLLLEIGRASCSEGGLVRGTANVAVPQASVVESPLVGVTLIPAVSSSVFVRDTSAAFRPL